MFTDHDIPLFHEMIKQSKETGMTVEEIALHLVTLQNNDIAPEKQLSSETGFVTRIIPGDWGKVESGWLAQPLLSRAARFGGGGRIHQFLWQRSRAVSHAKRD